MRKDLLKKFTDEIYSSSPKKTYETNKTMIKSTDDTSSSDLLDMNDYGPKNNRGYRYINWLFLIISVNLVRKFL